jgi:hypothetical protein
MATKMINREYCACVDDYRCEFVCDTDEDFATLPKACVGSTAVSLTSGAIRVVNTAGEWVAFGEG